MVLPLNQIDVGETVRVVWTACSGSMGERLADLGFVPREEITCVLGGRPGGMRAYLVRNAVIGLRDQNSREIFVQRDS